jgi:SAM-dependent methyltransferase
MRNINSVASSIADINGQPIYFGAAMSDLKNKKMLALQELLQTLGVQGYQFTAVTPLTHRRFLLRADTNARNSRDVFGWNLPFTAGVLPPLLFDVMMQANLLVQTGEYFRSKLRIASVNSDLFLHSAFPTDEVDAIFLGPDTYRFARFVKQSLQALQLSTSAASLLHPLRILDVGCGSGAGGISAVRALAPEQPYALTLNDVNPLALDYAAACAQVAAVPATILEEDFFAIQNRQFDLIVANPPYLHDEAARLYRDGGENLGLDFSIRFVKHALSLLAPGGILLLYTGVAITNDDVNPLMSALAPELAGDMFRWSYEELDPDIFGEELERAEYQKAHRIAAVGLTVARINVMEV